MKMVIVDFIEIDNHLMIDLRKYNLDNTNE